MFGRLGFGCIDHNKHSANSGGVLVCIWLKTILVLLYDALTALILVMLVYGIDFKSIVTGVIVKVNSFMHSFVHYCNAFCVAVSCRAWFANRLPCCS